MASINRNPNTWYIPKIEVKPTRTMGEVTDGRKVALAEARIMSKTETTKVAQKQKAFNEMTPQETMAFHREIRLRAELRDED